MPSSPGGKFSFSSQVAGFFLVLLIVCVFSGVELSGPLLGAEDKPVQGSPSSTEAETNIKIAAVIPPSRQAMDEHISNGVRFLLQNQNADGSWGDGGMTKAVNLLCAVPGGHLAFRAACTSLDVMGLSQCAPENSQVQAALDRAENWLLSNLGKLRRPDDETVLNFWGHAYGIRALCALSQRVSRQSEIYARLEKECRNQVNGLMRYSDGGGGWGYYEFADTSSRPNGAPTSFCTATGLLALKDAELTFGIKGDRNIINKAVKFLSSQRLPVGSYLYSYDHYVVPTKDINTVKGSLARTPACNAALYVYGQQGVNKRIMEDGLEQLWARAGWLDMARKKPEPHESFAENAGYFFYYGYFYAAENIQLIDSEKRPRHSAFLARTLLPLQERDGSWWDFPLYNYHKAYGTGYALYSLAQARGVLYGSREKTR